MGRKNFSINYGEIPPRVDFEHAFAGSSDGKSMSGVSVYCVDSILRNNQLDHLSILHADTQGAELDVLLGASASLKNQRIDWIFLSTHSNELHRKCLSHLESYHYKIVSDADLLESFSFDGLIVACRKKIAPEKHLSISLRKPN
jgi:hypothetical protein